MPELLLEKQKIFELRAQLGRRPTSNPFNLSEAKVAWILFLSPTQWESPPLNLQNTQTAGLGCCWPQVRSLWQLDLIFLIQQCLTPSCLHLLCREPSLSFNNTLTCRRFFCSLVPISNIRNYFFITVNRAIQRAMYSKELNLEVILLKELFWKILNHSTDFEYHYTRLFCQVFCILSINFLRKMESAISHDEPEGSGLHVFLQTQGSMASCFNILGLLTLKE